ncbi:unnamed protein product [Rangifer tarandus platyrhynchus]|uniref:Uncharacterized protein n=2 Tax=Rangifer tarandus platyrhynchus TaxID=3082113 RepID=A0ACB0EVU8_RANTA|nr:unnamed protein product [Rangifer tarandus platyrhynchus]CAI9704689.1 unnamed protein product [Rangifer tarandus platyrhynchus]
MWGAGQAAEAHPWRRAKGSLKLVLGSAWLAQTGKQIRTGAETLRRDARAAGAGRGEARVAGKEPAEPGTRGRNPPAAERGGWTRAVAGGGARRGEAAHSPCCAPANAGWNLLSGVRRSPPADGRELEELPPPQPARRPARRRRGSRQGGRRAPAAPAGRAAGAAEGRAPLYPGWQPSASSGTERGLRLGKEGGSGWKQPGARSGSRG